MNRRRHDKRRWGLRSLKFAAWVIALFLLGFLSFQVLLSTSWIRGKVAGKLSQRIGGLEVAISELKWTPWNGVTLRGLKVKQPEALREQVALPLLEIEEIHAWPDYGAVLKRQWTASELTIVRPRAHVAAEMLASIAASSMPAVEAPPAMAAVVPVTPSVQPPVVGEVPAGESPVAAKPSKVLAPAKAPESRVVRKRMRVVVEDGRFELVLAKHKNQLMTIDGVKLDLPFFGEAGETSNSVASIKCLGQSLAEKLNIQAKGVGEGVIFYFPGDPREGLGVFGSCSVGLVRGLPFQSDLMLRLPKIERIVFSDLLGVQAGELQIRIQGSGWLQVPSSWRLMSAIEVNEPVCWLAGQAVGFDVGSVVFQLASGLIQSPDFRMIGDSGSVLGNGWVTSNDGAVVVRLVVPYSVVGMVNEELGKRVPNGVFAFRPLDPDSRWYSDVSLWREELGWSIGLGDGGTVMALDELLAVE